MARLFYNYADASPVRSGRLRKADAAEIENPPLVRPALSAVATLRQARRTKSLVDSSAVHDRGMLSPTPGAGAVLDAPQTTACLWRYRCSCKGSVHLPKGAISGVYPDQISWPSPLEQRRICIRASVGHGVDDWSVLRALATGASQERHSVRQSPRELRTLGQEPAVRRTGRRRGCLGKANHRYVWRLGVAQ